MRTIEELWKIRVTQHINETRAYLKYMLNDHLLFVLIFLAAGGALTYSNWLQALPPDFPGLIIMTVVFVLIMMNSNVRTLLKEADIVFLLPMEKKLKKYFTQALIYSFITQSFLVIVVNILFAPLYMKLLPEGGGGGLLITSLFLLLVKLWNLRTGWFISYYLDRSVRQIDFLVRVAINFSVIYFILSQSLYFVMMVLIIMAIYDACFLKLIKSKAVKWDYLIKREEQKRQSFYKLANLFTDVPKLKQNARRRRYLDWILHLVPYHQGNVYEYLYMRAFIRSGDYLGILLRLTIIGSVILALMNTQLVTSLVVVLLFNFLTGIQMMSLYKHFDLIELPQLYPNAGFTKMSKFLRILFRGLIVQTAIFSLVNLVTSAVPVVAITFVVSSLFVYLFVFIYTKKRLLKQGVIL